MRALTFILQGLALVGIGWSLWAFMVTLNAFGPAAAWVTDVPLALVNLGVFAVNGEIRRWLDDRGTEA